MDNLSEETIFTELERAVKDFRLAEKRVLVIIPDGTRSAPIPLFFRLLHRLLGSEVDYIIALGTHQMMSAEEKRARVGISEQEQQGIFRDIRIMNHRWDKDDTFRTIGKISAGEMRDLTDGLMGKSVDIHINRIVFEYDIVVVLGPVFPHEVVGFSGSNKYLFPGICGWNFIETTHWLAALKTNRKIIGLVDTPVRRLIDHAAGLVPVPLLYFNLVVDHSGLKGLYIGDDRSAWEKAAVLSSELNVFHPEKPYRKALSMASTKYTDLWTGAKAAYKIEPAMADHGELVVYAPGIKELSFTHGETLMKLGLHVRDYFLEHMDRFRGMSLTAMAFSTLIKGEGIYVDGIEKPRIEVILATGIPEKTCRRLNIGYRDPGEIETSAWENREDEGVHIIRDAGEVLHRH